MTITSTTTTEGPVRTMDGLLNGVVMRLTLRATLGRKRAVLFALPAIVLIALTALLAKTADSPVWPPEFLGTVGLLVVALTSLLIGSSVLGGEVEDGSIVHLLATPVSRRSVVLSKYAVAVLLTWLFAALPLYVAGVIAKGAGNSLTIGLFVGALAGTAIYVALFVLLTASFSPGRALAIGLLYVLLWEGLLANLVPGVGLLSVEHYALGIANSIAHNNALHANVNTGTGIGMGAAVVVVALVVAIRRLSAFSVKGDVA
ncbi:MAG: ABC transporter permease [Actinobacteria bacterium]|nr:ABC transporter permease [Actinomycetota bacterium]MBO0837537.1 ABC transporter permease [Actinomycetota bacterium]